MITIEKQNHILPVPEAGTDPEGPVVSDRTSVRIRIAADTRMPRAQTWFFCVGIQYTDQEKKDVQIHFCIHLAL